MDMKTVTISFYGASCFCWYNRQDQEQYNFFLSTLVQGRDPAREKITKSHISKDLLSIPMSKL